MRLWLNIKTIGIIVGVDHLVVYCDCHSHVCQLFYLKYMLVDWVYNFLCSSLFNFIWQKRREDIERMEKERQAELRSYKNLMVADKMTSNKDIASTNKSLQELEDDFMWWCWNRVFPISMAFKVSGYCPMAKGREV